MPTLLIPCPNKIDCPGTDNPFVNLSAEAPDVQQFWEARYAAPRMPLGAGWGTFGGIAIGTSDISQSDAGGMAQATVEANTENPPLADESDITPPPGDPNNEPPIPSDLPRDPQRRPIIIRRRRKPPVQVVNPPGPNPPPFGPTPSRSPLPFFANDQQQCARNCSGDPDDASQGTFFVRVAAGTIFSRHSTSEANLMAQSQCAALAVQGFCLEPILAKTCEGVLYSFQIPTSPPDADVVGWALTGGALSAGLAFNTGTGTILGVPTTPGISSFAVTAFDGAGNFAVRNYTLQVVQITTNSLPSGTVGTPYAATLHELGGTPPVSWQLIAGSLPAGLSLNESTGVISGTPPPLINGLPNPGGTSSFTILLQDAAT